MNIHDMYVRAMQIMQAIPKHLERKVQRLASLTPRDQQAIIAYAQQARIEALERVVRHLASAPYSENTAQLVHGLMKLQEPDCGSEPEEDSLVTADLLAVQTLVWAEGPLAQLVKHKNGDLYILSWANVETVPIPGAIEAFAQINYYVATQVTQELVDAYLRGEVSMYTIQKDSPKLYFGPYVNDEDELYSISYEKLDVDYKATEMSYYDLSLAPPK